ncbi:prepilin peptidase [Epibacterium sp. MM17-32]|uniref:prepilin peptidase n=1 Tax=Epibacterium sp. MM17-32 TaxID=2917734 RepID=UPI001EF4DB02|nr:prepilin peptidase [Epibacterium sp. MM17-32]MCG7628027.1 prepilin peptidase [Epibacterium sp. MM17-32]
MQFPAQAALWFLPFVAPLCFIVALTDLREMRIPNWTVDSLAALYVLLGMLVMPSWTEYGWQLLHLPVGLAIGFLIYAAGLVGAGDAKFAGAAAPYVALADLPDVAVIFAFTLLSGFLAHRIARHTPLRRFAPSWKSWDAGSKFPMGLCLGATLAIYLCLAAFYTG